MTSRILYLLELAKRLGRLGHSLSTNDTGAYLNLLHQIRDLTTASIIANTPRLPFRVVDDVVFDEGDDDEL